MANNVFRKTDENTAAGKPYRVTLAPAGSTYTATFVDIDGNMRVVEEFDRQHLVRYVATLRLMGWRCDENTPLQAVFTLRDETRMQARFAALQSGKRANKFGNQGWRS